MTSFRMVLAWMNCGIFDTPRGGTTTILATVIGGMWFISSFPVLISVIAGEAALYWSVVPGSIVLSVIITTVFSGYFRVKYPLEPIVPGYILGLAVIVPPAMIIYTITSLIKGIVPRLQGIGARIAKDS
jgi:hypothetical protein